MRNPNEIPQYCGECRFFNRGTCYNSDRRGFGHYGVTKYSPVCYDIKYMQGGYTNDELWNKECRELRRQGRYDSDDYVKHRGYEI